MKIRKGLFGARSAFDDYETFQGWKIQEKDRTQNLLKQLNTNLFNYESCYHSNPKNFVRNEEKSFFDKENNYIKFPAINCLSPSQSQNGEEQKKNKKHLIKYLRSQSYSNKIVGLYLFDKKLINDENSLLKKDFKKLPQIEEAIFHKKHRMLSISKSIKYEKLRELASSKISKCDLQYQNS